MLSIIVNIGVMCLLCCCKTISYDILFVGFVHMYFNWFGCFCVAVEGFVLCVFCGVATYCFLCFDGAAIFCFDAFMKLMCYQQVHCCTHEHYEHQGESIENNACRSNAHVSH